MGPALLATDLLLLVACAAAILASGRRLVGHADRLAEGTGLGRTRVGLLFVAGATSVPEIVSGLAAASLGLPDLAVGNVLGTLPLNLGLLAVADLAGGRLRFWTRQKPLNRQLLALVAGTAAVAALALALDRHLPSAFGIAVVSPVLLGGFMWGALRGQPKLPVEAVAPTVSPSEGLRRAGVWFAVHAVVIAVAAVFLPSVAARLADATGLGRAFIGATVLAVATTLPELTVAVSAARIGAHDLIVGNAFGSILFNLALLGVEDVVYDGVLLADAAQVHLITLAGAVPMLAVIGFAFARPPRHQQPAGWPTWVLLALYLATLAILFAFT